MMLTGCRNKGEHGEAGKRAPEPEKEIDEQQLVSLISRSKKPFVLVNFFATWCKPCKQELPDLVELRNDPAGVVDVILISVDEKEDVDTKLESFLGSLGVDFVTYTRSESKSWFIKHFYSDWKGDIPLNMIFNNEGKRVEVIEGVTNRSEIDLLVNRHQKLGGA